ncbi:MAG: AI-2E family transporter [Xylophilus ampelinus]
MKSPSLENKFFLLLLATVSVAFVWILLPFFGAVFWAGVLALIFTPFFRWILRRLKQRRTLAALLTLLVCLVIVILPTALIGGSLVQEGSVVYQKIRSGDIDFGRYFQQIVGALPQWVVRVLDRFDLGNFGALQQKLTAGAAHGSQVIATQALTIGQNTFDFLVQFTVMLYLLFFLLRDGGALSRKIRDAIPLREEHKRDLLGKFATVIRATVKGNIAVAVVQGALGGIAFWFLGIPAPLLWGVVMAFLSLLPAVGAGLIWLPVAVYLLVTGSVWEGVALIVYGVLVIGLVDNILRPLLVGKDTKMPDYVVLISTLGGMALFGLNGFVIGPVIAAMFMAVWDLFASSRHEVEQDAEVVRVAGPVEVVPAPSAPPRDGAAGR